MIFIGVLLLVLRASVVENLSVLSVWIRFFSLDGWCCWGAGPAMEHQAWFWDTEVMGVFLSIGTQGYLMLMVAQLRCWLRGVTLFFYREFYSTWWPEFLSLA